MKQDVAVISLDAYAGQFYAQQVQELFGERITVCSYSVRDGSIEHMPRRYDLYMVTTDAFDSLGDLHQYVPIDGEMMEIHVTLRWDVVRRLQSLPAGKRALFVNLSDKMCREAVTRLNQLGVNQLVFDLYHPGAPEPDMGQYDFVITPQETRYVPAGAKEIIDIGQRVCDSSTMIEAALRLGLEELLESERFEQYQREVATNTYSFDRVFARGLRLESQFEMLMEILDEGIVGVNERGEVFACNRKLEEITGIPCGGAFVAINCAAMPENLLESELFGYEEGAFTGARKGGKPGLFEFAHGGTLFLDEVEGMSTALQCKLLRVLQEREIMRVGGNRIISVDVRIVAATNEDLERRVEEGSFRRDLYYRLNTLPVLIPPLREREGDLLLLIDHFCRNIGASFTLSPELERLLLAHQWRGNIRELRNVVEYFSYLGHTVVGVEELPPTFHYLPAAAPPAELPALADCPREDSRFVLERLYEADQAGRSLGREAILAAAREAGLPCSQQEVRRILAGLDRAGLVRVSRGRGGTRLTPAGRALCRRQAVEGGAEMV